MKVTPKSERCAHSALLYESCDSLCSSIAEHVDNALHAGGRAVVLATADHIAGVRSFLRRRGCDVGEHVQAGVLTFVDAAQALEQIMLGEAPQRQTFLRVVDALLRPALSAGSNLFVYGELVNLLWMRGSLSAAAEIEKWWNELLEESDFALLCGYRADPFDDEAQALLEVVCSSHSQVAPAEHGAKFEESMAGALHATFPHAEQQSMREYLAEQCPHTADMPMGLATLMGLRRVLPPLADRVRLEAAWRYRRAASPAQAARGVRNRRNSVKADRPGFEPGIQG